MINFTNVAETFQFAHGNLNLVAGLCDKLHIREIINKATDHTNGRQAHIDYGTMGTIMLSVLASGYIPLYRMKEYFAEETIDLEGIYKQPIDKTMLTDDRFAWFLDKFYDADPQKIFATISTEALHTYGIKMNKVNFDTTSKVMWGEYDTYDGKRCKVEIDFGHSKDKRPDKKQLKIGLGTANGLIVEAEVLSGHKDDKSYNQDNVNTLEEFIKRTHTSKEDFYYIADSAAFSEKMLVDMNNKQLKLITKMPETTLLAKELICESVVRKALLPQVKFKTAQGKESLYAVDEKKVNYKGIPLTASVCYSNNLKESKTKTLTKQANKALEEIEKLAKKYTKRKFACLADAEKEKLIIECLPLLKKAKFTKLDIFIETTQKKTVGRPSIKEEKPIIEEFALKIVGTTKQESLETKIDEACTFVLVSNDLEITAEAILMEYVVRRGLANDHETIIGPGQIIMGRPTLLAIMRVMTLMSYRMLEYTDGSKVRIRSQKGLSESQLKILKYLELDEGIYLNGIR